MSELNQNSNEVENTTSQTETQATTTTPQDDELKITFLGTGIKDHKSYAEETIVKGQKVLKHTPILDGSLTITKNNVVYDSKNGLVVNAETGTFSVENVNLEGGVAKYQYYNRIGLCAVLQVGGKTFLFDVGGKHFGESDVIENPDGTFTDIITETENELVNFLTEQGIDGITKFVDAVVLTHFHNDHVGDVEKEQDENNEKSYRANKGMEFLLKNKSEWFKNCIFYFPHQCYNATNEDNTVFDWSKYSKSYYKTYLGIKNTIRGEVGYGSGIEGANIICPDKEGYDAVADIKSTNNAISNSFFIGNNTSIKFYNVDSKFYNEYFENQFSYTDGEKNASYNNFSMVTIIEHYGNKIAITGDIEYLATKNVAKAMSDTDVIQIEHHDLNHRSDIGYLNNITANIGIVATFSYYKNNQLLRPTANKIISNGGKVYYTGDCGDVTVVSNKYGIYVENDVLPMPAHTSMSYNLDYGSKILTEEDLNNLITPGVYCAGTAPIFNNLSNQPIDLGCGSKIIVENMTGNPKVLRQTVIKGNTETPAIAYRNKNSDNIWSDWYYNYPSIYGKLTGGSYKISSNKEFEVFVRTEFTPTDSIEVAAGYYSNELYYSLKFLEDYGLMVENACVFGMSDYSYTIVNGEVLKRTDSQPDRVKFRLLKKAPITVGSGKLASLLIKGTLVKIPKEDN